MKNTMSEMVTVFCPRGCNITRAPVEDAWDECANCGQIMRPYSEDSYESVHLAIEEREIAKCERKNQDEEVTYQGDPQN